MQRSSKICIQLKIYWPLWVPSKKMCFNYHTIYYILSILYTIVLHTWVGQKDAKARVINHVLSSKIEVINMFIFIILTNGWIDANSVHTTTQIWCTTPQLTEKVIIQNNLSLVFFYFLLKQTIYQYDVINYIFILCWFGARRWHIWSRTPVKLLKCFKHSSLYEISSHFEN